MKMQDLIKKIVRRLFLFLHEQTRKASLQYSTHSSLKKAVDSAIEHTRVHQEISSTHSISVDLGSGTSPRNIFGASEAIGVDFARSRENNVICCDLSSGNLPFPDTSIDFVTAFDFIEHVSRVQLTGSTLNPFINLMNEVFRVLRAGGIFLSHTPAYPFAGAFQDPTHTNIITEITFPGYFCKDPAGRWQTPWASQYGFTGTFVLVSQYWLDGRLITVLGKEQDSTR